MAKFNMKRIISLGTFVLFGISSLVIPNPLLFASENEPSINQSVLALPSQLGSVSVFPSTASSRSQVVYIQDAHANYEAQSRIRDILKLVVPKLKTKTILVEGASLGLDPSVFQLTDSPETNKALAERLSEKGYVTGDELFTLEKESQGVQFLGLEDENLYDQDRSAFKSVIRVKQETEKNLSVLSSQLAELKARVFDARLKEIDKKFQAYQEEKASLLSWFEYLGKQVRKSLGLSLNNPRHDKEYPNLVRLAVSYAASEKINPNRLETEKRELIHRLFTKKSKQTEIESFIRNLGAENQSLSEAEQNELRAFRLFQRTQERHIDWLKFPEVRKAIISLLLAEEMEGERLFQEMESLAELLYATVAKTEEEKKAIRLSADLRLMKDLLSLEVTRDIWEQAKLRLEQLKPSEWMREFKKLVSGSKTLDAQSISSLDAVFDEAVQFYQLAEKREAVFAGRIEKALGEESSGSVIVVGGGFHTEGLLEELKEKSIHFLVIQPRLEKESDMTPYYQAVFQNTALPFLASKLRAWALSAPRQTPDPEQPNAQKFRDQILTEVQAELREGRLKATKPELAAARSLGGQAEEIEKPLKDVPTLAARLSQSGWNVEILKTSDVDVAGCEVNPIMKRVLIRVPEDASINGVLKTVLELERVPEPVKAVARTLAPQAVEAEPLADGKTAQAVPGAASASGLVVRGMAASRSSTAVGTEETLPVTSVDLTGVSVSAKTAVTPTPLAPSNVFDSTEKALAALTQIDSTPAQLAKDATLELSEALLARVSSRTLGSRASFLEGSKLSLAGQNIQIGRRLTLDRTAGLRVLFSPRQEEPTTSFIAGDDLTVIGQVVFELAGPNARGIIGNNVNLGNVAVKVGAGQTLVIGDGATLSGTIEVPARAGAVPSQTPAVIISKQSQATLAFATGPETQVIVRGNVTGSLPDGATKLLTVPQSINVTQETVTTGESNPVRVSVNDSFTNLAQAQKLNLGSQAPAIQEPVDRFAKTLEPAKTTSIALPSTKPLNRIPSLEPKKLETVSPATRIPAVAPNPSFVLPSIVPSFAVTPETAGTAESFLQFVTALKAGVGLPAGLEVPETGILAGEGQAQNPLMASLFEAGILANDVQLPELLAKALEANLGRIPEGASREFLKALIHHIRNQRVAITVGVSDPSGLYSLNNPAFRDAVAFHLKTNPNSVFRFVHLGEVQVVKEFFKPFGKRFKVVAATPDNWNQKLRGLLGQGLMNVIKGLPAGDRIPNLEALYQGKHVSVILDKSLWMANPELPQTSIVKVTSVARDSRLQSQADQNPNLTGDVSFLEISLAQVVSLFKGNFEELVQSGDFPSDLFVFSEGRFSLNLTQVLAGLLEGLHQEALALQELATRA